MDLSSFWHLLNEKNTKTHTTIILKDLDLSLKNDKRLNEQ